MVCVTDQSAVAVSDKRCVICGSVKPVVAFGVDRTEPDGRNISCKRCLRLRERQRRASHAVSGRIASVPPVLGLTTGEAIATACLGALRERFDGVPSRFARCMLDVMREADAPTRLAAGISLAALLEWSHALIRESAAGDLGLLCDSLSDAAWQAIADRQARRRGPETTEPRKE